MPCRPCSLRLPALLCAIFASGTLWGKDRLVLQPPEKASPMAMACEVVDYTADVIAVHVLTQTDVRRFPAEQVTAVEAVLTEAHRQGVQQFESGEIFEAERHFVQALQNEPRHWVRREILGWLVRCAMRRKDRAQAGERFLRITASTDAPREYRLIPLVWGATEVGISLRQQARQWLTGETEVSRLLGASVLLLDQSYAEATRIELRRLASSVDHRIAALAGAQLWRLRVPAADVTSNELAEWEREIESMPRELRAGPYFLLGRAAERRSEYDRAAAAYLWLTTVYSENGPLTAQATVNAGRCLERLGRMAAARSLLQEVVVDFEWSTAAAEARSLLNQLPVQETHRDG